VLPTRLLSGRGVRTPDTKGELTGYLFSCAAVAPAAIIRRVPSAQLTLTANLKKVADRFGGSSLSRLRGGPAVDEVGELACPAGGFVVDAEIVEDLHQALLLACRLDETARGG